MKKKSTVLAGLLLAVAVTSYSVAGTYARYTSSIDLTDEARIARFDMTAIDPKTSMVTNTLNLFADSYSVDGKGLYVKSLDPENQKVIAPGTKGEYQVNFAGDIETRYMLTLNFEGEDPFINYGFQTGKDGQEKFTIGFGSETYSPITYKVTLFDGDTVYGTFQGSYDDVQEQIATYNESETTKTGLEPGKLHLSCKVEWQWNADNKVGTLTEDQVNELDTFFATTDNGETYMRQYKLTVTATQVAEDSAIDTAKLN